jgi:hypothetical protein
MFTGKIDSESLNDPSIIKELNIVESRAEHHPEAKIKTWHCFKVSVPNNKIVSITERVSKEIKKDWFSIFWDEKEIFVVFSNKVFRLAHEKSEWEEAIEYGTKLGIQKRYLDFEKEITS